MDLYEASTRRDAHLDPLLEFAQSLRQPFDNSFSSSFQDSNVQKLGLYEHAKIAIVILDPTFSVRELDFDDFARTPIIEYIDERLQWCSGS